MSAKSLLSHQTAPPLGGMPTVESQKWNRDLSAEWQISSEDESLYDEFEAEGFTREELKAINAIAPLGQKLQDAALLNGLEEVDDMRMEATRDLNGLGTVGEGREGEKREGGRKKKRKKGGELSVQEGKEQDTHRVNQEAGNPAAKHERRAKRNSNTEEPERPPKRKKTAAELEQEHWRKIERPPRDNKKDQEKQDHIAAIDDEIRGTRDFANAKQLEIYEHGGMPEIDKQMKQDLEEMKRERDTLRDGEELNKRNRKKRKSAVRDDGTVESKAERSKRSKSHKQESLNNNNEKTHFQPPMKQLT